MPTENRSSDTEQMVSVPREWVENYAGLLEERCAYEASERVRALLSQPANQPAEVTGDDVLRWMDEHAAAQHQATPLGWVHGGGQEFTACPDHAHDLRAEGIDLTPAYSRAQHQGEPVVLPACKAKLSMSHDWDQGYTEGWTACLDEIAKLGPLYARAALERQP